MLTHYFNLKTWKLRRTSLFILKPTVTTVNFSFTCGVPKITFRIKLVVFKYLKTGKNSIQNITTILVQSAQGTLELWISRSIHNVDLLLICLVIILIIPRQKLKEAFTRGEITKKKRLCINPQIKSAHSGYQDHVIRIMGI